MNDHDRIDSGSQLIGGYPNLQPFLASYTKELSKAYGDGLVGVCLYGSLARGCYHPSRSDVDVIAVIRDECVAPDDSLILEIHRGTGLPMDVVFVTESQLNADVFPAPVAYLVKPVSDCIIVHQPEGNRDFLLQRQDAYEAGIALAGPFPNDLIRPVPWPLLGESLDCLFPHILPHFKNPALMLSRIVYAWTNRRLCSKRDAGEWAMATLGEEWAPMIRTAIAEYGSGSTGTGISKETLQAFEQHCFKLIAALR